MSLALDSRITTNPKIKGGRPCIAGRRISVHDIVIWHERMGMGVDSISAEYDLSLTDIYIALAFYYANRERIDQTIREDEQYVLAQRKKTPSKLQQKLTALGTH
jgi:uncharacterized protein (DUF433 family)